MMLKRKHIISGIVITAIMGVLCFINIHYKLYAFNHVGGKEQNHSESISIMSHNIALYDSASFHLSKQEKLLDLVKREKPDILCFQELSFESLTKIKPQLDSIYGPCNSLKGDNLLWRLRFYSHFPLRNFKRYHSEGDIDTLDLDSLELKEYHQMKLQMGVMSAEFEVKPGKWVTLFSGHLRSSAYSTARRSMNKDASWFDGISLYKRNYKVGKRIRDYEAENVRRFIDEARVEGKPVIVAGDLNDWCGSDCLNVLMRNDLKDAWWEGGCGFGWTYFGWHLRLRLDHILFSGELELVDVKVVDSDLSDHKPLVANFFIK